MKKLIALGLFALSVSVVVLGAPVPVQAQSDAAITFYRGTVTQVDPESWSLTVKTDAGAVYTFRVARFADLDHVAVGDRVQAEAVPTWGMVLSLKKIAPVPRAGAAWGGVGPDFFGHLSGLP